MLNSVEHSFDVVQENLEERFRELPLGYQNRLLRDGADIIDAIYSTEKDYATSKELDECSDKNSPQRLGITMETFEKLYDTDLRSRNEDAYAIWNIGHLRETESLDELKDLLRPTDKL